MRLFCKVFSYGRTSIHFKSYHASPILFKIVQFKLSDIGEGIREVTVKDWFVNVGDQVSQFQDICLVESDKASVSITSRYDGTVKKLHYQVGDVALVGNPLVDIDVIAEETSAETEVENADATESAPPPHEETGDSYTKSASGGISKLTPPKDLPSGDLDYLADKALATPAVRRIAKENNIPLNSVKATGKGGRVLKEDILRHLGEIPLVPVKDLIETPDKKIEITGIRKAMVKTMTKSNTIPTFGYCDEVDLTALVDLRKDVKEYAAKKGINITYMPFFIKALSKALEEYPDLNASVDDNCEHIIYKSQHNIGIAMDTGKGLIVPNIKNVQSLSVLEISRKLNKLMELGRAFRLGPQDLSGGTISISNIGIIGGTYLRPLILPPEVCILALGKSKLVPVFDENDNVIKKHILNASWAADHRIIDGATLAKFSNVWKEYIENPNYLLTNL